MSCKFRLAGMRPSFVTGGWIRGGIQPPAEGHARAARGSPLTGGRGSSSWSDALARSVRRQGSPSELVREQIPRAAEVLERRVGEQVAHAGGVESGVLLDLVAEARRLVGLFQER